MSALDCPSDDQFVQLLQGQLEPSQLDAMHEHIEGCSSCAELARHIALMITPLPLTSPPAMSPQEAMTTPTHIGRYRIKALLGLGGMGVVYRAFDPELERDVALKLLRPDLDLDTSHQAEVEARQLAEARALATVEHPNVLPIFEVGQQLGRVYLVMQLVEGRTARAVALSGQLDWPQLVALYLQAARGLKAAHHKGIIHRDIKPDNLMVNADGHVFLTDFGLARAASAPSLTSLMPVAQQDSPGTKLRTLTGSLVGTPAYMSPEQLDGQPATARSDIFSWCVSLYEALYGFRPYAGQTLEELRHSTATGKLVQPTSTLPTALFDALAVGLRPRAAERYQDMDALILAVEAAISAPAQTSRGPARAGLLGAGVLVVALGLGVILARGLSPELTITTTIAPKDPTLTPVTSKSAPIALAKPARDTPTPQPARVAPEPQPEPLPSKPPAPSAQELGSSVAPTPKRVLERAAPISKPERPKPRPNTSTAPTKPSTFTPLDPKQVSELFEQVKEQLERSQQCLDSSTKLMAMVHGDPDPPLLYKGFGSLHAECLMLSGRCDEGVELLKRRALPHELRHSILTYCLPSDTTDEHERWRRYTGRLSFSCSFSMYACDVKGPCRDTIQEVNAVLKAKPQAALKDVRLSRSLSSTLGAAATRCLDRQQECAMAQETFAISLALEAGQTHVPSPTLDAEQMIAYGSASKTCSPVNVSEPLKLAFEVGRFEHMAQKAPYAKANDAALKLATSAPLLQADVTTKRRVADAIDALVARQLKSKRPCQPLDALALEADRLRLGSDQAQQEPHTRARAQRLEPSCPIQDSP